MFTVTQTEGTVKERYTTALEQLRALVSDESDAIANLSRKTC